MPVMEDNEILAVLHAMENDPGLVTESAFRANSEMWPDHRISFIDTHLAYLKAHPTLRPDYYLSNLKLRIRKSP